MAKLKDVSFNVRADSGQKLDFKCEMNVSTDGEFTLVLPEIDGLDEVIRAILLENKNKPHAEQKHRGVHLYAARKYWHVRGDTMQAVSGLVHEGAEQWLVQGETREMVILYKFDAECHYAIDKKGGVYCNGNDAMDNGKCEEDDYVWGGSDRDFASHTTQTYSIGLGAEVKLKITSKRGNSERVAYEHPDFPGSHHDADSYGKRLNGFITVHFTESDRDDIKEIPYTEEAARFFYDFMIGMCKLHHGLSKFFAKDTDIHKFISDYSGNGFLQISDQKKVK